MGGSCGVCGWPARVRAGLCEACGAPDGSASPRIDDRGVLKRAGARPEDWPELEHAFAAWRARDAHQMVPACIPSLGLAGARHVDHGARRFWPIATNVGAVFIVFDAERDELAVEAPLLELPDRLEVPLMRFLLDSNGLPQSGHARYCVRDGLVVLRWARRLASCSPPELVDAIREAATRSERVAEPLAAAYYAPPVGPKIRTRGLDPALLGMPLALAMLERRQRTAPAAPARERTAAHASPPESRRPPPLSASFAPPKPDAPRGARTSLREETQHRLAAAECFAALMNETVTRSRIDDPPLAVLIQRAGIFRASHEFGDALPDAVATLFAAGAALVQRPPRLKQKSGFFGFGGGSDAAFSPSILPPLMARLARDLGDVPDAPRGAAPSPFDTVVSLKAHLRDLVEDLESGPIQPEIKAFILLGAVAEMLVRSPVPRERLAALVPTYEEARVEPPIRAVARLRHLLQRWAS